GVHCVTTRRSHTLTRGHVHGGGHPSVVVDGPVTENLEILRPVPARSLRIVEGVHHTHAFHRRLNHAVDRFRFHQTCSLENGRRDVNHMVELASDLPGLDARGPTDHQG